MAGLLPVETALEQILDGAAPLDPEAVAIGEAAGRVLAGDVAAARSQPPFPASAMDGYAVRAADIAAAPAKLSLIGASIAGRRFEGHVGPGQAVRIFTGAPVPDGADTILIQEDAQAGDGTVTAMVSVTAGRHIRCAGFDFRAGETVLPRGRVLDPAALSLAATTGRAALDVVRRPRVAILSTGSELVPPGVAPGPDQIVASNAYGVAALVRDAGGEALDLGIVADDEARLRAAIRDARASGADVVVTLGGASVGDHDLVAAALAAEGMAPGFWKIAMRPGKPLLFGRFGAVRVLGLPGNPVSSLVCGHVFLKPLVAALAGLPAAPALRDAVLAAPMKANDHRQDYVRAVARQGESLVATPFATQDSSVLTTFAAANALIVRAPGAPAAEAGDPCAVLMLR
jgi:molybdopterin molybdotransferase